MSVFSKFAKNEDEFRPVGHIETIKELPPGIYNAIYDRRSEDLSFVTLKTNHDQLINLPGTPYEEVMGDLEFFLTEECRNRFTQMGFLHKMNILLWGTPGGGKTCIVNRVAERIVNEGGIVLFNPMPDAIIPAFKAIDQIQPNTKVLVILEELDQLIENFGEDVLLHVLDGELQKKNAMFIATTNYVHKVPARIRRPGRFPIRLEVAFPTHEARLFYCNTKFPNNPKIATEIAEKTEGFTIDQLKEVIRAHYCMNKSLNTIISQLRREFNIGSPNVKEVSDDKYGEAWEDVDSEN